MIGGSDIITSGKVFQKHITNDFKNFQYEHEYDALRIVFSKCNISAF